MAAADVEAASLVAVLESNADVFTGTICKMQHWLLNLPFLIFKKRLKCVSLASLSVHLFSSPFLFTLLYLPYYFSSLISSPLRFPPLHSIHFLFSVMRCLAFAQHGWYFQSVQSRLKRFILYSNVLHNIPPFWAWWRSYPLDVALRIDYWLYGHTVQGKLYGLCHYYVSPNQSTKLIMWLIMSMFLNPICKSEKKKVLKYIRHVCSAVTWNI